jgi:hypothetical protein
VHDVGQERERPLPRLIPDRHLPKRDKTSIRSMWAGQSNHLIGEHGATVNLAAVNGNSTLDAATQMGHTAIAEMLRMKGGK